MSKEEQQLYNKIDSLVIKSKKDLKEKLQQGINDIEKGAIYSLDEVLVEIDNIWKMKRINAFILRIINSFMNCEKLLYIELILILFNTTFKKINTLYDHSSFLIIYLNI